MSKRSNRAGTEELSGQANGGSPPTTSAAGAREADAANSDAAPEVDFSRGQRGDFLPADPAARAARLEARVLALQRNGAQLRDEYQRLQILLAWEAGILSEEQAAKRLAVDPARLRAYRQTALRAAEQSFTPEEAIAQAEKVLAATTS